MSSSSLRTTTRSLLRIPAHHNIITHASTPTTTIIARGLASQPPLNVEMPGMPKLQPASLKPRPKTQVSVLPNGLRVISEDTYGASSSIALFVDAGSRFENDANNGVSHMLEQLAFKSTAERSHQRIVRDVEEMGATVSATSAREYTVYTADVLRPNTERAVELVAETVLNPKFAPWDIEEQRAVVEIELQEMEKNAQAMVTEMLYAAAYTDSTPLGRPLFCPLRNLHKIGAPELQAFYKEHYHANRMILAAAGVDHNELLGMARKYFGAAPAGPAAPKLPVTKYVGGDLRLRCDSPLTQVALGFNAGGWTSPQLLPSCVMHMMLGGGTSFSPGGPGKGLYSRLNINVLNKHHWADSAIAFQSMHTDAGIVGIYATAEPQDCDKLVDVMASELLDLASKPPTEEETQRSKNQLKSSVFMNLESRQVLVEDLGRQMLSYGKREDPSSLCARIDKVTPEQIQQVAKAALASPVTLVAFGDVSHVPSYDRVASRFR